MLKKTKSRSKWYIRREEGDSDGPYTSWQIQMMAKSGEVQPTDQMWKEGLTDWIKAKRIKGLFPKKEKTGTQRSRLTEFKNTSADRIIYDCPECEKELSINIFESDSLDICPFCAHEIYVPKLSEILKKGSTETSERIRIEQPVQEEAEWGFVEQPHEPQKQKPVVRPARVPINEMLPSYHRSRLDFKEKAYLFEWVDIKGGCGTRHSADRFIMVTNKSVIYEAEVRWEEGFQISPGSLPLEKIQKASKHELPNKLKKQDRRCFVRIEMEGYKVEIVFISEEKAIRVMDTINELVSDA